MSMSTSVASFGSFQGGSTASRRDSGMAFVLIDGRRSVSRSWCTSRRSLRCLWMVHARVYLILCNIRWHGSAASAAHLCTSSCRRRCFIRFCASGTDQVLRHGPFEDKKHFGEAINLALWLWLLDACHDKSRPKPIWTAKLNCLDCPETSSRSKSHSCTYHEIMQRRLREAHHQQTWKLKLTPMQCVQNMSKRWNSEAQSDAIHLACPQT